MKKVSENVNGVASMDCSSTLVVVVVVAAVAVVVAAAAAPPETRRGPAHPSASGPCPSGTAPSRPERPGAPSSPGTRWPTPRSGCSAGHGTTPGRGSWP